MATELVDVARDALQKRLAELDDERPRLVRALEELDGKPARRRPGPKPKARPGPKPKAKRSRRGPGGKPTRKDQALVIIQRRPGVDAQDIGKTLKMNPNYLYRVLGELVDEKKATKKGRKYFPVEE